MLLKSCSGICCTIIHAVALVSAAISLYFFLGSTIERLLGALLMLVVAITLEVIAAIVSDRTTART